MRALILREYQIASRVTDICELKLCMYRAQLYIDTPRIVIE